MLIATTLGVLTAAALAACFGNPEAVRIEGWSGDAMEPFVSRDGSLLFFNSSNAPGARTDIYWARRESPLRFRLLGPVSGANSPALNGVPSLARDGAFVLISPRAYDRLHATVWVGRWSGATVEGLEPQPGLTPTGPGGFDMDAEVSADGRRLYLTQSLWSPFGAPKMAILKLARRGSAGWGLVDASDDPFARVNSAAALSYAADVSADERELFFTRAELDHGRPSPPKIWVATRPDAAASFSAPAPLTRLTGYIEGPSIAPDGSLYFHMKRGDRFVIMRAPRDCRPDATPLPAASSRRATP